MNLRRKRQKARKKLRELRADPDYFEQAKSVLRQHSEVSMEVVRAAQRLYEGHDDARVSCEDLLLCLRFEGAVSEIGNAALNLKTGRRQSLQELVAPEDYVLPASFWHGYLSKNESGHST